MEVHPGIEITDLALFLKKPKVLVVSDLHVGFEESLARKGVLVPRFQYKDVIDRLEQIFARTKADVVVLNGDLKHEFGPPSKQEWKELTRLMDYLSRKCKEVIIVKGNHDVGIGPLARKKEIRVVDEYVTDDVVIVHGDARPKTKKPVVVMGHEHTAITLREGARAEKYKCFLKGKHGKSTLITMPSFNTLTEGTDVTKEKLLSPLLQQDLSDFEVFVWDARNKEALCFGTVNDLL